MIPKSSWPLASDKNICCQIDCAILSIMLELVQHVLFVVLENWERDLSFLLFSNSLIYVEDSFVLDVEISQFVPVHP